MTDTDKPLPLQSELYWPRTSREMLGWLRRPELHLQLLLGAAFLFGGGGSAYGLSNLIVEIAALICLALNLDRVRQFSARAGWSLRILLLLTIAMPLLQIMPLPPVIWTNLPGRDLITSAYQIAGLRTDIWLPMSFDKARTLGAFFATLAPSVIIIIGSTLKRDEITRLTWTVVALALAGFGWGVLQLSSANTFGMLYADVPRPDVLYAVFANRNSTGLLFVITIILLIGLPIAERSQPAILARATIGTLMMIAVILTQSRSSMALLLIALLFLGARVAGHFLLRGGPNKKTIAARGWLGLVLGLTIAAALAISLGTSGRVAASIERFSDTETDRPEIWEDTLFAARHYWPVGSGTSTFDEVFQLDESLEYVSPRRAGRAHNDYLELSVESGVGGLVLLLGWGLWSIAATFRNGTANERWFRLSAGASAACIALQSVLDYPLRNQIMLCMAALIIVILAQRMRAQKP